jgi:glycine/D-amino acid oxidase-like deaminating enzyme/nitrite reductase/ring-hydroxylating ferredoxin subunit
MSPETGSLWSSSSPALLAPTLEEDGHCDVCIVGAGIAGLTTAYLLACEEQRVIVLDAKPKLASGETEMTTAHLAWELDDRYSRLISIRGESVAKAAADSHREAIDLIAEIVQRENIHCDFKRVEGYLFPGDKGRAILEEESLSLTLLGLPFGWSRLTFPGGQHHDCLTFPDHAQFHPIKYLTALIAAIRLRGGTVHTRTVVESIRGGSPCTVKTTHGRTITAGAVVIATNNPFEGGTTLHTKVSSYITYAIAAEIPKGSVKYGLYWDTEDPYHYVRIHSTEGTANFDHLIVGGEDHKTGQAADQPERWDRLAAWAKVRFPKMGSIRHHWSGQVYETPDGLALIGLAPWNGPNVYIITGDSGMGMTHGTIGGRLITDQIFERPNSLAEVYSPSRWMLGALKTFLGENLDMAAQFADWLTGGDVASERDIPDGHGAIVRRGLQKLAVYRDDRGKVTTCSAVCPHMGCLVRWNPGERTWDCPCHGSRFSATGTCLHGPATTDLTRIDSSPNGEASTNGEAGARGRVPGQRETCDTGS